MSKIDLSDLFETEIEQVKAKLSSSLNDIPESKEMTEYFFEKFGKLIRSRLIFAISKRNKNTIERVVSFAAGIELMHAGSLVHDDIIDEDENRRQKQTVNKTWTNSSAVLFGDILLLRALEIFGELKEHRILQAAINTGKIMCAGQLSESLFKGNSTITHDDYINIAMKKTAKLFETSARGIAILENEDEKSYAKIGLNIGMAFQIIDDKDDLISKDLPQGYATLPFIYAYSKANEKEKKILDNAISLEKSNQTNISEVENIINEYDGYKKNNKLAYKYLEDVKSKTTGSLELTKIIDTLMSECK